MKIENATSIRLQWDGITLPILKGTPISLAGEISNDEDAAGIIPETVYAKPPTEYVYMMTGGSAYVSELGYELSEAAMQAMRGILFLTSSGPSEITYPDASATEKGMVLQAENVPDAEGEAPTAAEFKALLDALKDAGIMAPDSEPEPDPDDTEGT